MVAGEFDHPVRYLARFWLGFALRTVTPLVSRSPWTWDPPWHYARAVDFLKSRPWCLVDALVLNHRSLYRETIRLEFGRMGRGMVPVAASLAKEGRAGPQLVGGP